MGLLWLLSWAAASSLRAQPGPGWALQFDGTNGVVQLQNPVAPFPGNTNTFTIEFWAQPTGLRDASAPEGNTGTAGTTGQRYAIFPDRGDTLYGSGHAGVGVSVGINGVGVFARGDNSYLPPLLSYVAPITITNWTHVAVVIETNRPRLYLNGLLVRTGVVATRILHPSVTMGDPGVNYGHYQGTLDEVRIWSGLRSPAQLQAALNLPLAGNEAGLATYYRLDEGTGDVINDATGGGRTGQRFLSAAGYPLWVTSTAPVGTPVVNTTTATQLFPTTARLNGTVQPHGLAEVSWFQWGATTNYGITTPTNPATTGFTVLAISQAISNLTVGNTYHYRIAASNSVGLAYGADAVFVAPFFGPIGAGLPQVAFGFAAWGDFDNDDRLDILLDGAGDILADDIWSNTGTGFAQRFLALSFFQRASVALADFNRDGNLDILATGADLSNNEFLELRTNNAGGFIVTGTGINGIQNGGVAVGDFDNDGLPDILLAGFHGPSSFRAEVWRNTGNGFSNINANLTGVTLGAVAWADYDNDGKLDFILTGASAGGTISQLWRNTSSGFTNVNAGLTPVRYGAVAWGDYDNDGRLDLLLTGQSDTGYVAEVWRNTGNGFTNIHAGLTGFAAGSAAWGDYDNDGRLDILVSGQEPNLNIRLTQVWRNTGTGFALVESGLPGLFLSAAKWGDYDKDGRLDILLAGQTVTAGPLITDVWRSAVPVTNTPPTAPGNLTALPTSTGIALNWNAATDAQTPSSGLSYNFRVGTTPGSANIVSPEANLVSGFRRVVQMGNAEMRTNAFLNLPPGRYYWSVQAVDTAFAGGLWAGEQSFVVGAARFTQVTRIPLTGVQIGLLGYTGLTYRVTASTNVAAPTNQWATLTNFTIGTNGVFQFIDGQALGLPARYYRAVTP